MRFFLIAVFTVIFAVTSFTRNTDMNYDLLADRRLADALELASDGASEQVQIASVANGDIVFNQAAADSTFKTILANNLALDPSTLTPLSNSMYQSGATVNVEQFFDYSNTTFPYTYDNPQYGIDVVLTGPAIVYNVTLPVPKNFESSPSGFPLTWTKVASYPGIYTN
ncbi:hypothetical protein [Alicyclobacillus mengziensis]|uniref:Uncharacterized protein n=1 Tax=Alicyclobacillus mengziensis TaxID=2931921 RepID=A0A9X7W488_9BACL|nr:hypothetical protein [Alicyclobacillus mengziensis]QSO50144.1 hypothetical protein JZ786_24570 [Alicyclobacillus mengziensis]